MENSRHRFAGRLREALIQAGYEAKPAVLEREFNLRYWGKPVTLHGVRRWLKGETLPTEDKLLVLANWLQVDPRALRFGEDGIPQRESRSRYDALTIQEREVIDAFLKLSQPRRRLVRDMILSFAQAEQALAVPPGPDQQV